MGVYGDVDKAVLAIQRRRDIEIRLANECREKQLPDERQEEPQWRSST